MDERRSDPGDHNQESPPGSGPPSADLYNSTGSEVAAVLQAAHDAALEMTTRAEEEARRVRIEAEAEVARLQTQAAEEAQRVRMQAHEEDERRRRDLDQELARARLSAEEEERRRRDEAETALHRHGDRMRSELKAALDEFASERVGQIREAIHRIDAELHRLHESIDEASLWVERSLTPVGDAALPDHGS